MARPSGESTESFKTSLGSRQGVHADRGAGWLGEVTPFTQSELTDLLEKSRVNNAALDISGMLLYKDGNFMQVLEGDEGAVRTLYDKVAAAIGPKIIPKTLAEAVKADIIFLAVRFEAHPDVAKALPTWQGKTVIDVTNAYRVPPEELGGQPSSKFVAHAFTGARLVKGFNHLVAAVLDQNPAAHGGRRVVFLASDDDGAADEIAALAANLGFASIKLGGLSEGGLLVQARGNSWGRLIFKDLVKFD